MRRKSERNKAKPVAAATPPTVERPRRGRPSRTRRKKSSSEDEPEEPVAVPVAVAVAVPVAVAVVVPEPKQKPPSDDDETDQVWHVKASEGSGDSGEIRKLKICLSRPGGDSSPKGRKKSDRSGSRGDASAESAEEKKRGRHRSRRISARDGEALSSPEPPIRMLIHAPEERGPESEPEAGPRPEKADASEPREPEAATVEADPAEPKRTERKSPDSTVDIRSPKKTEEAPAVVAPEPSPEVVPEEKPVSVESPRPEPAVRVVSDATEEVQAPPKVKSPAREEEAPAPIVQVLAEAEEEPVSQIKKAPEETPKEKKTEVRKIEIPTIQTEEDAQNENETKSNVETGRKPEPESPVVEPKPSPDGSSSDQKNASELKAESSAELKPARATVARDPSAEKESRASPRPTAPARSEARRRSPGRFESETDASKSAENNTGAAASRKRRWGARPKPAKSASVGISTDSLKSLISDVEPVSAEEVLCDIKPKERPEPKQKRVKPDDLRNSNGKHIAVEVPVEKEAVGNLSHRKISIVHEEDSKLQEPPSPPKYKTSSILYITNLVRPFTLSLLKNVLQRTGRIVEGGFWIDKIKSKCYVEYENEDQAIETRHALHGVTWPVSNPKTLNVDFGSREAMDEAIASTEDDKSGFTESWQKDLQSKDAGKIDDAESGGRNLEKRTIVREWDLGKGEGQEEFLDRPNNRLRDMPEPERRKRRSKSHSPSPARKFKKKEEEAPSKLLDDLFKKTKATPCIYWLPLNPDVILVKEEQRRKHMAEHERRLEELRKAEEQRMSRHNVHHSSSHRHR